MVSRERLFFSPSTPATNALIASLLLVYCVQCVLWWGFESTWAEDYFALSWPTLQWGEWWQLITHAWLHSTQLPFHLIFNLVMLRGVAPEMEMQLGRGRFLGLFVAGVLGSAGAYLVWDGHRGVPIVGASGAIFCILMAFTSLYPTRRVMALLFFIIPLRMRARTLGRLLVLFECGCIAFGWLDFVAHSAHLGGALVGWSLGTWLRLRRERKYRDQLALHPELRDEWPNPSR